MLRHLRVRNLALAENVAVTFEPGLNVITGETGAGKSVLIGALGLLLGERADKSLIRTGENQCTAEALFELADPAPVNRLLEETGLPPCEDGQLVIRRIVRTAGGQNLLNDAPVTLPVLRRVGEQIVDLHGPHDHQSLFRQEAQLEILDAFGRTDPERTAYAEPHAHLRALEARREELTRDGDEDVAQQVDLLQYRIREIEAANPREGEEEEVRREQELVGNAQRVLELSNGIVQALTDGDEAAFNALVAAQRPLEELERLLPAAAEWRREAADLATRVQELGAAVRAEVSRIEADPARLEWLDERLAAYQRLHRKYGGSVARILETLETSRARLKALQTRGEQVAAIDTELAELRRALRQAGEKLHRKRAAAADELADAITGELQFLGFPHSAFAVELREVEPRADGLDEVEFGFAPNVGEAMRPLRAIASSGEISRVMLATKAVLAQHDRIPVLVFDEIDANLGGEMGDAVGRELAGVAERRQVICITHLPQVAAHGATHLAVAKHVREGRTFSEVQPLDAPSRVEEIARMLGGAERSESGRRHARELLAAARR